MYSVERSNYIMFGPLLMFVLVQSSAAVIYNFNDTGYARMPPLYHLDSYEECFDEPDSVYCFGEFVLVSDEPSELLTMTQEFSENFRNYNHTLLRHGYCVKKTCYKFYNVTATDLDQKSSLEACANETIYKKYKLKTRLTDEFDCSKRDRNLPFDYLDIFVGVVCIVIILSNLIGSLCDHCLEKGKDRGALRFLCCFSMFRNWKKFIAPAGEGRDYRYKALRGVHGIRSINIILVLIAHSFYASLVFSVNTNILEDWYKDNVFSIFTNGPLIMQSFFLVSSFLLVYNWLMESEKRELSWSMLPKQIIMRYLRLTPSYALVLGLSATWFARLVSGAPYWKKFIYYEKRDCRRDWWKHLLYINNYTPRSNCLPQTWYLAADTQLYIFAVVIFLMCRTNLVRKLVLSLLFVIGLIIPALHVYYQDLFGVLRPSLDDAWNLFMNDPTFNKIYTKGHTNLAGYVIGMAVGHIIYNWQKSGGDPKQFQKYRHLYWCLFPMGALMCWSGHVFFLNGPPPPLYINLLYAALQKPAFAIVIAIILAGIVIQFEGLYRPILEWRPFTFIGRLSFSAYMLHAAFIRTETTLLTTIQRTTLVGAILKSLTIVTSTFIGAFFFCMMVETPFANIVGAIFRKPHAQAEEPNKESVKDTMKTENENGMDMSQTKTEDGTVIIKMGTRTTTNNKTLTH